MKNIHVLPTDKPSRLHLYTDENGTRPALCELEYSHTRNTQNIYITSDEEIKEGDWYFDGTDLVHKKTKYNDALVNGNKQAKKVILTTDADLVKDGVQAIDDEFLEWFVKNPSCEEIYVNKIESFDFKMDKYVYDYKIIIPKEEPKQETLEEVAERLYPTTIDSFTDTGIDMSETERLIFINGAKWQQEQILDFLYSEITERRDYSASKMCEKIIEFIKNK